MKKKISKAERNAALIKDFCAMLKGVDLSQYTTTEVRTAKSQQNVVMKAENKKTN